VAQRPEDPRARDVEEWAAGLLAVPGAVAGLLLNPGLPIHGRLHSRLFGSGMLWWNTAAEVRRLMASGALAYVVFGAAEVPEHVRRLGIPVVLVGSGGDVADVALRVERGTPAAEVVAAVRGLSGVAEVAPAPLRVGLVGAVSNGRVAAVAEALAARCRLDVFTDDDADPAWLERLGASRFSAGALIGTTLASSYDGVVHALGDSAADVGALRSARRVPGVLWLRERSLAGVHRAEAASSDAPAAAMAALLRRVSMRRAPAPLLEALDRGDAAAFDAAAERRYGLLLTGEVVRVAQAAIVSSEQAARRLRLDQGAGGPCPPLQVADPADPRAVAEALMGLVAAPHAAGRAA
jgi:hypothetical protein